MLTETKLANTASTATITPDPGTQMLFTATTRMPGKRSAQIALGLMYVLWWGQGWVTA